MLWKLHTRCINYLCLELNYWNICYTWIFSNLCKATFNGSVSLQCFWSSKFAASLSPFACMVSISLLRLSTAPSTFYKNEGILIHSLDVSSHEAKQENWGSNTLVKSTENVSSGFKIKAPFSYNQLNCNACPFLKTYSKYKILGGQTY